jgi:segregation and condensation protein B
MRRIRLVIRRRIVSDLDPTNDAPEAAQGSRGDAEAAEDAKGSRGGAEAAEEVPRVEELLSASPRDEQTAEEVLSAPPRDEESPREHERGELDAIVEALIFASPEPLTLKALYKLLNTEPAEDVSAAVERIGQVYERPGGLQLVQVAGGYQIVTRPELHEWVRRLFHEQTTQKLSVQALETLSVIAYKQPVTAAEITEIRGVNTSGVLNTLLERQLIKIAGRKQVVGRPFLYATTREFLDRFGLKDLTELPKIEDMAGVLGFEPPAGLAETSEAPSPEREDERPAMFSARGHSSEAPRSEEDAEDLEDSDEDFEDESDDPDDSDDQDDLESPDESDS